MKKAKNNLKANTVQSDTFHVGIELELRANCENSNCSHDDEACYNDRREMLLQDGPREALMNYFGLSRNNAEEVSNYFNFDSWIDDHMSGWGCDDSECCHRSNSADDTREEIQDDLIRLTGNTSFKVVEDGSIHTRDDETDAEVCWNYFASKDTIRDNEKILNFLKENGCSFDTSCGLHINLNNYLSVPQASIPTQALGFLFNLVAPSRSRSTYCNKFAMSGSEKYSMLYNQGDRVEFRFFSPTLEAEKLNNYVSLANVVYRRLAGQNVKLSKRVRNYFIEKMTKVNGLTMPLALDTIYRIDTILPATQYAVVESGQSEDA